MSLIEQPLDIECDGCTLPGVLSLPEGAAKLALLIVVGGPQYRVGSHRQFVSSARAWAAAGWPVLRFDVRGMGDAEGEARSFEQLDDDIAAAIDALLRKLPDVAGVILYGLCDGASAALMYCARRQDSRVAGLCLLNPWLRSEVTLAKTHLRHYYGRRLLQREFWTKLMSGRVAREAVRELMSNIRRSRSAAAVPGDFRELMSIGWRQFGRPLLLLISGADLTAREFEAGTRADPAWQAAFRSTPPTRIELAGADHTLSRAEMRAAADAEIVKWMQLSFGRHSKQSKELTS